MTSHIDPGERKPFKLKVTTPDPLDVKAVLDEGGPDEDGFKTKYFRKDQNISAAVNQPGYAFNLQPGHPKTFRMTIKLQSDAPLSELCRDVSAQAGGFGGDVIVFINDPLCVI